MNVFCISLVCVVGAQGLWQIIPALQMMCISSPSSLVLILCFTTGFSSHFVPHFLGTFALIPLESQVLDAVKYGV